MPAKYLCPKSFISQAVVIFCNKVRQWSPQARCQSLSDSRSPAAGGEDRDKEASLCSGFAGGGTVHSSYWEHVTQEVKIQLRPMPACYPSTSEVEVAELGAESQPRLHSKFQAWRSYHRLFQNNSTEREKEYLLLSCRALAWHGQSHRFDGSTTNLMDKSVNQEKVHYNKCSTMLLVRRRGDQTDSKPLLLPDRSARRFLFQCWSLNTRPCVC